jgi:hypothetical protein
MVPPRNFELGLLISDIALPLTFDLFGVAAHFTVLASAVHGVRVEDLPRVSPITSFHKKCTHVHNNWRGSQAGAGEGTRLQARNMVRNSTFRCIIRLCRISERHAL